jgi:uncharacterized membrane protein
VEKWKKLKSGKVSKKLSQTSSTFPLFKFSTSRGSHRVIFIDLVRALAVAFMLYGHTASALLAPRYQVGRWFDIWQFQRGLTSSLFLLLGGFAFSIATSRHWASHMRWSPALVKRIRRFGLFVILGYALHLPASRLVELGSVDSQRWRAFLAVDILQAIGVAFILIQLLVLAARSRRVFMLMTIVLAAVVVLMTPLVWTIDWSERLPLVAAAYFSPATGSQFPLFPWMGFILLGAGLGQLYARWGASDLSAFAQRALIAPGVLLVIGAFFIRPRPHLLFGTGPGNFVPGEVMMRVGACLIILAAFAHLSRRLTRLPHVFGAVAQESLLIYFVHLCIVYGSVWNRGLVQLYGASQTPLRTVGFVILVVGSMAALAYYWNGLKHVHPRAARLTSYVVGGLLLIRLL